MKQKKVVSFVAFLYDEHWKSFLSLKIAATTGNVINQLAFFAWNRSTLVQMKHKIKSATEKTYHTIDNQMEISTMF